MLVRIPHYSQSCRCLSKSPTIHSPADACQNPPLLTVLQMLVRIPPIHSPVCVNACQNPPLFSPVDACQNPPLYSLVSANACHNAPLFSLLQMLVRIPHKTQFCKCLSESPTIHSSVNACQNPPLFTILYE